MGGSKREKCYDEEVKEREGSAVAEEEDLHGPYVLTPGRSNNK